ncbi:hypothetical protein F9U64_10450 [Gracilibacillus oryzae]|uniref:Lipoprotein n=1 Tax=Gracilibacillus oryzae TaxID=1672701 RepID=A0A7C8KZ99_9BACI|nr:hypothetical protein [Gracilibacillus oryzae]KAB8136227.1 hypothetical protein F9U64_10450 [Gracilibacillus oryzae]
MKKMWRIFALLVFFTSGCAFNEENTVSVVDLTEREEAILSTVSDHSFLFDFTADSEYKELTVWVDKYESGKLVEKKFSNMTIPIEQDGMVIYTTVNNNDKSNLYNLAISSGGSTASSRGPDPTSAGLEKMMSVWGTIPEKITFGEEEVVLASICYSDSETGVSSLPEEFYENVEGHKNELEDYDVAYLLKAEFKK